MRCEGRGAATKQLARIVRCTCACWLSGRDLSCGRYFISLYWSMTTFSTNGYGDFTSQNEAEVVWSICYMMWNLGLSAYILGEPIFVSVQNHDAVIPAWVSERSLHIPLIYGLAYRGRQHHACGHQHR